MSKKLIALAVTGAAVLAMAVPALATRHYHRRGNRSVTTVVSSSTAYADTGLNNANNSAGVYNSCGAVAGVLSGGGREIDTGDANATSDSTVRIRGSHQGPTPCMGPFCGGRQSSSTEVDVYSVSSASAFTGGNSANDSAVVNNSTFAAAVVADRGGREIDTGDATANSSSWVVIGAQMGR